MFMYLKDTSNMTWSYIIDALGKTSYVFIKTYILNY